ncbi:hypothetical protein G6F35_015328 [Rhizopus arrhizus]|nr:hypothetical protein G6F35_015328 [Rhizopus arrhizus]
MAGRASQVHRVLAGHHRYVAIVVRGGVRAVASGEYRVDTRRLEGAIDVQATHGVVLAGDLCGQGAGTCTGRPDDGRGVDAFTVLEGHAFGIHVGHARTQPPLHAQLGQGLGDDRPWAFAEVRTQGLGTLDHDDVHCGIGTEHPAPAITTVLRPAFSGRSARCSRCTCNRAASAI